MLTMSDALEIDSHLYGRLCARRPRPDGIRDIPGQISEVELRGLYYLMKEEWCGRANVLEVGTLFGMSTQAIALGMRENPRVGSGLHFAVDGFGQYFTASEFERLLAPWLSSSPDWPRILDDYRREGFEHAFCALHRDQPYAERLRVRRALVPTRHEEVDGALTRTLAECGECSVAFIDSAKDWFPFRMLMAALVPHLSEGALVLFQDYQWFDSFAIPVVTSVFGASFARRAIIDTTHVFEYRGGLTEAAILSGIADTPSAFGLDRIEAALRAAARDAYLRNDAYGVVCAAVQIAFAAAVCGQPDRGHEMLAACGAVPGFDTHHELLDAVRRGLGQLSAG